MWIKQLITLQLLQNGIWTSGPVGKFRKTIWRVALWPTLTFFSSLWNILDLFPRWLTDKQKRNRRKKRLPVPFEHSKEILVISVELQQTLRCNWEDTVMLKLQEPPTDSKPLMLVRLRVCDTSWWKNKSESSPPPSPNAMWLTGGYLSLLYSFTMRGRTLSIICSDPPQKSWSLITVFTEAFCNTLATPQGCKWQQNAYVGINN